MSSLVPDLPAQLAMVIVTSNESNLIRSVGSNIMLICTITLSTVVDVPVTVNTMWTGPDGTMVEPILNNEGAVYDPSCNIESDTYYNTVRCGNFTYKSVIMVTSFTREKFGFYNCTAIITVQHDPYPHPYNTIQASNGTRFSTGKYIKVHIT